MTDRLRSKKRKTENEDADTWRREATSFQDLMRSMYASKIGTDVIIKVGSGNQMREIECHSPVLIGHSPVLAALLSGRWSANDNIENRRIITFPDDNPYHFKLFVDTMYADWNGLKMEYMFYNLNTVSKEFTPEVTVGVLSLAHKYLAYQIIRRCRHVINAFLLKTNERITAELYSNLRSLPICDVGQAGRLTFRSVENCLLQEAKSILSSDAVLRLNQSDLVQIVQQQRLRCSELIIYDACYRWAKEQCKLKKLCATGKNFRSVLGDELIHFIRFPLLDNEAITNQVLQSSILTPEETIELMKYKLNPHCLDFIERPIRFPVNKRDEIRECQINRLDTENVSKTAVDFSHPHGFVMMASRKLTISSLTFGFYRGEKELDYINVKVNIAEKEFAATRSFKHVKHKDNELGIIFVKIDQKIVIPASASVPIKFHIKGGPTFVSQDIVPEETTDIVILENFGPMAITFRSNTTVVENGLKQVPIIKFSLCSDSNETTSPHAKTASTRVSNSSDSDLSSASSSSSSSHSLSSPESELSLRSYDYDS